MREPIGCLSIMGDTFRQQSNSFETWQELRLFSLPSTQPICSSSDTSPRKHCIPRFAIASKWSRTIQTIREGIVALWSVRVSKETFGIVSAL